MRWMAPVRNFVVERMVPHRLWQLTGLSARRFGIHEHAAIVLALTRERGPTALKSADLEALYQDMEFDVDGPEADRAMALLDLLVDIATFEEGTIRTRWGLVDLAISVMRLEDDGETVPPKTAMEFFRIFETRRRQVATVLNDLQTELVERTLDDSNEEEQIDLPSIEPDMLTYHLRFAREGATEENVRTRSSIMYQRLRDHLAENT